MCVCCVDPCVRLAGAHGVKCGRDCAASLDRLTHREERTMTRSIEDMTDGCRACVRLAAKLDLLGAIDRRTDWGGTFLAVPVKLWDLPAEARRELETAQAEAAALCTEDDPDAAARIEQFAIECWWEVTADVLTDAAGVQCSADAHGRSSGYALLAFGTGYVGKRDQYVNSERLHQIAQDPEASRRLLAAVRALVTHRDGFPSMLRSFIEGEQCERDWRERERAEEQERSRARTVFVLRRDGVEVARGDEFALLQYVHRTHGFSMQHALRYEGYAVDAE